MGYLGQSGVIQNLAVAGSVTATGSGSNTSYTGGVIGYNDSGTVENCSFTGTVTGNASSSAAGVNYTGGVAGYNYGTIENCYNTGIVTVTGDGNTSGYTGGVVGYNYGTIENCYNTGNVSGSYTGGVAGYNYGTIKNCYNTGTVTVTGDGNTSGYTGGVTGFNYGTIENCYNTGEVSVTGGNPSSYTGGVAGYNYGTIENCYNTGSVSASASGSGSYSSSTAGGICGINDGTIENCRNDGSVTANGTYFSTAGGVCGHNYNTVKNCLNTGKVSASVSSASSGYAGGVCGENNNDSSSTGGSNGTVTNCYYRTGEDGQGYPDKGIGTSNGAQDVNGQAEGKTSEKLASGEVAFLLNGKDAGKDTSVWRQNLDNDGDKDTYPVLNASHGVVYKITKDDGRTWYSNSKNISDCTVTLSQTTFTYNGQEQRPTVTAVEVDGETLEGGTDYTVTYPESSVNAGEYTITITGTGKYTGTVTVTYTIKAAEPEPEPEPTPTPTPPPYVPPYIPPKPEGPSTGTSDGWEDIREEIADAEKGDTITIDMNGETEVPGEIFEEVAGKDVTVEIDMGDVTWTVNGQDVPTGTDFTDLDLGVDMDTSGISVDVINTVTGELGSVQITLAHDGQFGFALTLTSPLGKENKGLWANLYHYDEVGETLNYETSAKIDEDGNTALRMTHASQYAIVIDEKSHQLPFTDLDENQWYEPAVAYAYRHDIMEGTSDTTFVPNKSLTRAEAVQVLYNLEGKPEVSGSTTFPDLVEKWYKPAIAWAEQTGVVDGYEDGTFRPGQPVNRMEFAQMLYNYASYKGYDLTAEGDLTAFPDGNQVQEWAEPAMAWANGNELINGHDDGTLEPGGATTRAQAAAILMRFDQNLAE